MSGTCIRQISRNCGKGLLDPWMNMVYVGRINMACKRRPCLMRLLDRCVGRLGVRAWSACSYREPKPGHLLLCFVLSSEPRLSSLVMFHLIPDAHRSSYLLREIAAGRLLCKSSLLRRSAKGLAKQRESNGVA